MESGLYPPGAEHDISEEWKPCPDFETKYLISNYGNIKSIGSYNTCKKKGFLHQYKKKGRNGYMQVCLYDKNKTLTVEVHILVAKAFLPNPNNFPMVNHIDEDKTNNKVTNLEWCTNKYNIRYSIGKKVCQYDKTTRKFIKEWECISEASNTLHIPVTNISKCCKGSRQTAGGFIWIYSSDVELIKEIV